MPTYRLKKSLNTTVDKRKRSIRGKARGSNDIDSDGEPFMRVKSRDDRAHSRLNRQGSFDSKNRKGGDADGYRKSFTREDNHGFRDAPVGRKVINSNAGIPGKKPFYEKQRKFEEDGSGREKGRSDVEGRGDSMGIKGRKRDDDYGRESRRSSGEDYALRAPHWKKDDYHGGRDSRRIEGRELSVRGRGDNMGFKGRKSDGDSGRESQRSSGEAYAQRGSRWKKDGDHGGRDLRRSEGREFSVRGRGDNIGFKGRKRDGKEIKLEEDGSGVENRSNGEARAERQSRWKEDDDCGGRDSYRSGGRELSIRARADKLGLRGKNRDGKQRKREEDDSEVEKQSNGGAHAPRYHHGNKDDDHGVQDSPRSEGRDLRLESRADMVEVKGKKRDGIRSNDKREGDAVAKFLGKNAKGQGRSDQIDVERLDKRQAQWLDKSGKKLDSHKKASNDSTAETDAPPRKRKRIKLDRYDFSNKRMDDGISSDEKDEKDEKDTDKEIKISQNAQFRAISPSPSILSFIEDNLLGRRRLIELQKAGYNTKLSAPLDNIPFSTCTDRERIEENVFRNKLEFFAAAKISSSFPPPVIPEIAFAGRSNVGKSSLLNALTRQWGVVRTSDKPGHTQSINFFRLASKLCLVDLPGYGFAYAKEEVKDSWEELVKEYVSTRVGLQRVCLLIDTKWGMKPRDNELIDLMERSQTPYQILLTKTDVVFPIDVGRRAMQIQKNLKANKSVVNPVMMVSSQSGAGIRSMRSVLSKLSRFIKP